MRCLNNTAKKRSVVRILVSGSLAYDRIMDFPGSFSDHIVPEKAHVINVSFVVNGMVEKFGGTAGNIAYALSLLGENPLVLATIGRDYERYFDWLASNGISTEGIRIVEEEFTAGAFITTDRADNQITGFNPGAMKYPAGFNFNGVEPTEAIAIISPGNAKDMMDFARHYKARGIPYVFDPGQQIPMLSAEDLLNGIKGSRLLIANDYEMEMILRNTGARMDGILEMTGAVITTMGEHGAVINTREGEETVGAARPKQVVDPTGAGDAYRAGVIKGMIHGKPLRECGKMGAVCAVYAVETYGTQEYRYTSKEYWKRYEENFGRC